MSDQVRNQNVGFLITRLNYRPFQSGASVLVLSILIMPGSVLSSPFVFAEYINPPVTNGLSHPYQLDESTFIFRDIRSDFSFQFHFSKKFM